MQAVQRTPAADGSSGSDRTGDLDSGRAEALLAELNAGPGSGREAEIRAELAEMHAPVVRGIARRYAHRGEPMDDLTQAAYLGLVKAINNFDPERGDSFVRYAFPMMLGEVKRHFRDRTWAIRVPRRLQELRAQLRLVTQDFVRDHHRSPTVAETAALLGLTEEETVEVITASDAYQPASLDAPVGDDSEANALADTLGYEERALQNLVDLQALGPLVEALPERERTILRLRFYGDKTQVQIAERLGCSQMHVSRLLRRTLDRLREGLLADA